MLQGIALVCLAVGMIGLSYGATAVAYRLPLWLPAVLGVLVLAAGSEFLFIGIIGTGGDPVAAVLAGLLVNARHVPYGISVPDVVGTGWRRILSTHLMNDETVALALAQSDLARKRGAYWVCGLGILICWPAGALLGGLLGSVVPNTNAFGLDAIFPAVLLALILPGLKGRGIRQAALVAGAIALIATPFTPAGLSVLLALIGLICVAREERTQ
jgi:4-azaleucine resistance transporter AzlC